MPRCSRCWPSASPRPRRRRARRRFSSVTKANAELDRAIGWDKIKPELIKLYTTNFTESELKDLNAFYQSPLGKKVLEKMPRLTAESAQLTQAKLQGAVEPVNKLMADMDGTRRRRAGPEEK